LLSELLLAAFDGWLLSLLLAARELWSDLRGGGADWLCDGGWGNGSALLASAAALLPMRLAKTSFPSDESGVDRASFGGAP
jgi:hypothetical protein